MSATEPAPPSNRAFWKAAVATFGVGTLVWVLWLTVTAVTVNAGQMPLVPGYFPTPGGECIAWTGPGWVVLEIFCFGTKEMCENFGTHVKFEFYWELALLAFAIWAVISAFVGLIATLRARSTRR